MSEDQKAAQKAMAKRYHEIIEDLDSSDRIMSPRELTDKAAVETKTKIINKDFAKIIIDDKNRYNLGSALSANVRGLRKILHLICDDGEKLLENYSLDDKQEIINKFIVVKKIAESKSLTETRVRFWLNDLEPKIRAIAASII